MFNRAVRKLQIKITSQESRDWEIDKIAQYIETVATKTNRLSSITGIHGGERSERTLLGHAPTPEHTPPNN